MSQILPDLGGTLPPSSQFSVVEDESNLRCNNYFTQCISETASESEVDMLDSNFSESRQSDIIDATPLSAEVVDSSLLCPVAAMNNQAETVSTQRKRPVSPLSNVEDSLQNHPKCKEQYSTDITHEVQPVQVVQDIPLVAKSFPGNSTLRSSG